MLKANRQIEKDKKEVAKMKIFKIFIGAMGTSLSVIYLFFRIRYLAKHKFKGFRERMLQNIIDFILVGFILILSCFQLQEA